jgi:hypothetical protein
MYNLRNFSLLNSLSYFSTVNTSSTDVHSPCSTIYQYPYLLDIGEPSSSRFIMSVAYTITELRTLAADITSSGHDLNFLPFVTLDQLCDRFFRKEIV